MRKKSALLILLIVALLAAVMLLPNEIKPNEAAPEQSGLDISETSGNRTGEGSIDITIIKDVKAAENPVTGKGSIDITIIKAADATTTPSETAAVQSTAPSPSASQSTAPSPSTPPTSVTSQSAENNTATVIFTFDDGYISDYKLAYPILKQYGIRGTSYIIPEYQDNGTPDALTWDMVKEMKAYGWVFGCHTYAHSDLTKMSADEIKQSMEKVNAAFSAKGLDPPTLHAFPYGHYDQAAIDAMKPYRIQMRKAFYETKFVDPKTANPYEIDSCSADMNTEERLKQHEALVDKAIEQNAIIVFRCHSLYRENVDDMGDWPVQTDSRLFKKLVEYCVEKRCRFMTMQELAQLYSENSKP